ncbi:MAG: alpha-galactosidase [Acidobacteriota bacterium]|nr:alpha-galactosidase [Acidobacteriota bacterium]
MKNAGISSPFNPYRLGIFTVLLVAALMLLHAAGCKTNDKKASSSAVPAQNSTLTVRNDADGIHLQSTVAEFVLTSSGYLKSSMKVDGRSVSLDDPDSTGGQRFTAEHKNVGDMAFDLTTAQISDTQGKLGRLGKKVDVMGLSRSTNLSETLTLEVYDDFPALALLSASFRNGGTKDVSLESVLLQNHRLNASLADATAAPHEMWSFFGSSLKWGKDDVLPIPAKFEQQNPFGAPVDTKDDLGRVGGGIPVVAFWTRTMGEAIGHIETLPLIISIPVNTTKDGRVAAGVTFPANTVLKPGEVYSTPRTFVAVYKGDYYEPLSMWSNAVEREGLARPKNNDENYAVSWCGWGYESDVTPAQMLATVPKLKELGIHWATLDDRWFNDYGDWQPRADTFGGGSIRKMVDDFHAEKIKVQLWWLPLAVEDGKYSYGGHKYVVSEVVKQHPDWLILDKSGKAARMTRNLATLCPAVPEVQAYYKQLTERFIHEWDFDGHKLDNIYATPPCYNPAHHHKSPMDSVYAMGEVYKIIFETTRGLKAASVTQSCPCGTPPSLAWFRYMDQAVTADPVGSVQVRRRMKMYKALLGPRAAVYGDHVELTQISGAGDKEQDIGSDFASTLGTGGVLGTKFTWPDYGPKLKNVFLNSGKEPHWKKWIDLYNEKMLSKGTFLDLYVYGYDAPEAYAIEKDGSMFYAFYAADKAGKQAKGADKKSEWNGPVELRGLKAESYKVVDYVNNKDYGTVSGPTAKIDAVFTGSLLLQATPQTGSASSNK